MPNDRLGLWMNELSARDVDFRGWSRSPKGRSQDRSAKAAALGGLTQYNSMAAGVFLGMDTLQRTWLHRSMKKATNFYPEKELAVTQTVWNNHTYNQKNRKPTWH